MTYNSPHAKFKMERVNHFVEYMDKYGENTNQAESFFSRFRRMQMGQAHKFGNLYLNSYAKEAAHREDTRRHSKRPDIRQYRRALRYSPRITGLLRVWAGY